MSNSGSGRLVAADQTDLDMQIAAHRLNAHKLSAAIKDARATVNKLDVHIRQISDLNELVRINNVKTRLMICADMLNNPNASQTGLTYNIDCADHLAFELAGALPNMWETVVTTAKDLETITEACESLSNYLAAVALGAAQLASAARSDDDDHDK